MSKYEEVLIVGGVNIHMCYSGKPLVKDLLDLLDSFGRTHSVNGPTHECTHTLDLFYLKVYPVVI